MVMARSPEKADTSSSPNFRERLRLAMKEIGGGGVEGVEGEGDWANLKILHHTARLLQVATRQSDLQISALRDTLEERDLKMEEMKKEVKRLEDRERELLEQNNILKDRMEMKVKKDKGSQVSLIGGKLGAVEVPLTVALLPPRGGMRGSAREGGIKKMASHRMIPWKNIPRLVIPPRRKTLVKSVRPIVKKRGSDKEIVGHHWKHFKEHPLLKEKDPLDIPPNPFWKGGEDEEEKGEEEKPKKKKKKKRRKKKRCTLNAVKDAVYDKDGCILMEMVETEVSEEGEAEEDDEEEEEEGKGLIEITYGQQIPKTVNAMTICKQENCMTTSRPYYVTEKAEDHMMAVMMREPPETSCSSSSKPVEVPQWRIVECPLQEDSASEPEEEQTEEETSDVAVLRRHSRLELDEKRRKRWESQRFREETYLERMKRKMEEREKSKSKRRKATARRSATTEGYESGGGGKQEEKDLDLHGDILYIRVSEDIPISIFGHPMPIIEKKEFELPWVTRAKNDLKEEEELDEDLEDDEENEDESGDM